MDTADLVKGGLHSSFLEILVLDSLRRFGARFAVVLNTFGAVQKVIEDGTFTVNLRDLTLTNLDN